MVPFEKNLRMCSTLLRQRLLHGSKRCEYIWRYTVVPRQWSPQMLAVLVVASCLVFGVAGRWCRRGWFQLSHTLDDIDVPS